MLKTLCTTNDKMKNSKLVNVIKSGLSDLKMKSNTWMKKRPKLKN